MTRAFGSIIILLLALWGAPALAQQGCGPANPNCVVPTAPAGTNNDQAASTAFVLGQAGGVTIGGPAAAGDVPVATGALAAAWNTATAWFDTAYCSTVGSVLARINSHWGCVFRDVYAADFGVAAASSDNTSAMATALAKAVSLGATTLHLPPGVLKFCSQQQWGSQPASGLVIAGAANGSSNYTPETAGQGTVIQACSSFSGTIQVIYGAAAAGSMMYGGGIRDVAFDGNNVAAYGLYIKDVLQGSFKNLTIYQQAGGAGLVLANSNNSGTQPPTGRNYFENIHIQERNQSNTSTPGIVCNGTNSGGAEGVTQNSWVNIIIDHADGPAISIGEDCDQEYWINLETFRANGETGNAIQTFGDASSVIGNWELFGGGTTAGWNIGCCAPPNVQWQFYGFATVGGFNTGITASNFITGTGAAGVSGIDSSGNFFGTIRYGTDVNGHQWSGGGAAPAVTSCGTSPTISGNDNAGTVTMGTGSPTSCTITFAVAFTNAPLCTVTWQSNLATMSYAPPTRTALTLTQTATSSNKVDYRCAD